CVEVNLRSAGYDVTVASNGEEGLEKAVELRPDLVLLDVMMPKLDGFAVAQRLRRDPRSSSSSIIRLTAKALSSDKVLGLCSGADDYIIKPFDPVEPLARVRGSVRRGRQRPALPRLPGRRARVQRGPGPPGTHEGLPAADDLGRRGHHLQPAVQPLRRGGGGGHRDEAVRQAGPRILLRRGPARDRGLTPGRHAPPPGTITGMPKPDVSARILALQELVAPLFEYLHGMEARR